MTRMMLRLTQIRRARFHLILPLVLAGVGPLALPVHAQDSAPQVQEDEGGFDLIEEGVKRLFGRFLEDMGPDLDAAGDDLSEVLSRLGPALRDLIGMIDDLHYYEAPVRLPNGDVIIRRKPGAPPPPPLSELGTPPDGTPEEGPEEAPPQGRGPLIDL